ncbi:hypothetical protein, partial [Variovorax fucosicus]|uniref:hypothetical protein n=1 Tax=Variovorax fucosicus TaxID=3053517 RepID=UPI0025771A7B
GLAELASLKQLRALIRKALRSSAAQKGSASPHRTPGFGVVRRSRLLDAFRMQPQVSTSVGGMCWGGR